MQPTSHAKETLEKMTNKQFLDSHPMGAVLQRHGHEWSVHLVKKLAGHVEPSQLAEYKFIMMETFRAGWLRGLLAVKMWPCFQCFPVESRVDDFLYLIRCLAQLPKHVTDEIWFYLVHIQWAQDQMCYLMQTLVPKLNDEYIGKTLGVPLSSITKWMMFALVLKSLPKSLWSKHEGAPSNFVYKGRSLERKYQTEFRHLMGDDMSLWKSLQEGARIDLEDAPEATATEFFASSCYLKCPKVTSTRLVNKGGICYANTSIQLLAAAQPFRDWLYMHWRDCSQKLLDDKDLSCTPCIVYRIVRHMLSGEWSVIDFSSLAKQLSKLYGQVFGAGHSPVFFIIELLEQLSGWSKTQRTNLMDVFCGEVASVVQCLRCHGKQIRVDPFSVWTVAHVSNDSVQHCFQESLGPREIESEKLFFCDDCKRYSRSIHYLQFRRAPQVMLIEVDRFKKVSRSTDLCNVKVNNGSILVDKFLHVPVCSADGCEKIFKYELVSFDKNTTDHVYAVIRDSAGSWTVFNDAQDPKQLGDIDELEDFTQTCVYTLVGEDAESDDSPKRARKETSEYELDASDQGAEKKITTEPRDMTFEQFLKYHPVGFVIDDEILLIDKRVLNVIKDLSKPVSVHDLRLYTYLVSNSLQKGCLQMDASRTTNWKMFSRDYFQFFVVMQMWKFYRNLWIDSLRDTLMKQMICNLNKNSHPRLFHQVWSYICGQTWTTDAIKHILYGISWHLEDDYVYSVFRVRTRDLSEPQMFLFLFRQLSAYKFSSPDPGLANFVRRGVEYEMSDPELFESVLGPMLTLKWASVKRWMSDRNQRKGDEIVWREEATVRSIRALLDKCDFLQESVETIAQVNAVDSISSSQSDSLIRHVSQTCVLCFEQTNDLVKLLQCGHLFHMECIDEWEYVSSFCPFCEQAMGIVFDGTTSELDALVTRGWEYVRGEPVSQSVGEKRTRDKGEDDKKARKRVE